MNMAWNPHYASGACQSCGFFLNQGLSLPFLLLLSTAVVAAAYILTSSGFRM